MTMLGVCVCVCVCVCACVCVCVLVVSYTQKPVIRRMKNFKKISKKFQINFK